MLRFIIILAMLSVYGICKGQYKTSFNAEYYHQLSEEANREYPDSSYEVVDIDSLNNIIFNREKVRFGMDTLSNWKILFEYTYNWTDIAGQPHSLILIPDTIIEAKSKNLKYAHHHSKEYTGIELFNGLEIDSAFLGNDTVKIPVFLEDKSKGMIFDSPNTYPIIFERNHPFNRVWTPIISGDLLLLRYVHSYPYGNLTSFYTEIIIYFKKVE